MHAARCAAPSWMISGCRAGDCLNAASNKYYNETHWAQGSRYVFHQEEFRVLVVGTVSRCKQLFLSSIIQLHSVGSDPKAFRTTFAGR